ncbi:MAG TPA: hypothetical protein VNC59_00505, partial [Thermoanaerobaculia bacterium]|nr:hypothetical protein [Thermoanaerobaculia bacterium]
GLDASYLRTLAVDRSGRTVFAGGAGIFTLKPSACFPAREDCPTAGEVVTYLPVVAGVPGAAGVRYSTSVRLENSSESPMSVSLEFFPSSTGGLPTASIVKNVEVPPEDEILIEEVVSAFFEAEGLGAVRLKSSRRVISTGEIALDGVPSAGLIVSGVESAGCARGRIPLRENAEAAGGASRANLGYFNPNPFPVSLALGVEREGGSTAGRVDLQIPGHSQVQYPLVDLLQTIPLEYRRLSSLSISYESTAPVLLYGVVVDSGTGDGAYLAGRCD